MPGDIPHTAAHSPPAQGSVRRKRQLACSEPPWPRQWGSHRRLLECCGNLSWTVVQGCFHFGLYQVFLCNIFLPFLKVKETSFLRNTIAECQACGKCFCGYPGVPSRAVQTKDLKCGHMTVASGRSAQESMGGGSEESMRKPNFVLYPYIPQELIILWIELVLFSRSSELSVPNPKHTGAHRSSGTPNSRNTPV